MDQKFFFHPIMTIYTRIESPHRVDNGNNGTKTPVFDSKEKLKNLLVADKTRYNHRKERTFSIKNGAFRCVDHLKKVSTDFDQFKFCNFYMIVSKNIDSYLQTHFI